MTRYLGNLTYNEVTIASSGTTSGAIDLQGLTLVQIIMPSAFTGTSMTFQSSHDNVTYQDLYDTSGNQISATVAASRNINIAPTDFAGCRYLKVVSGSAEGGARTVALMTREAM